VPRMIITPRRFLLPASLLGVGIYLLIGCIPLPGSFKPAGGKERPEKLIGRTDSQKPVTFGGSNWEQAAFYLGHPMFATQDRSATVHQYAVHTGTLWYPLCFWAGELGASKKYGSRYLLLRYNDQGKLRSFKVYKDLPQLRADVRVPLEPVPKDAEAR
jgi:hypothetical protein